MKITLFGYGKMGKIIHEIISKKGYELVEYFDQNRMADFNLKPTDVVIDFSTPDSVERNIDICLENSIPIVIGTTGWYDKIDDFKIKCQEKDGTILFGSNFSIGVNLFFKVNAYLAKLMEKFPEYNISILESHHLQKLDKPSGTAISLAKQIVSHHSVYKSYLLQESIEEKELGTVPIKALREDGVVGYHEIEYHTEIDEIKISHNAKSRDGFAQGAVYAAEFIKDKKGFFNYEELFN